MKRFGNHVEMLSLYADIKHLIIASHRFIVPQGYLFTQPEHKITQMYTQQYTDRRIVGSR